MKPRYAAALAGIALAATTTVPAFANCLDPGEIDTRYVDVRAGEHVNVVIRGDGDGDIDCIVINPNGREVRTDTRAVDRCNMSWNARFTGLYTVGVVNNGYETDCYEAERN